MAERKGERYKEDTKQNGGKERLKDVRRTQTGGKGGKNKMAERKGEKYKDTKQNGGKER